jgi:hypothetical protein
MTTFLFWNLHEKPLTHILASLALQHDVDVLMLAECTISTAAMLTALNAKQVQYHFAPSIGCEKVVIYTKFSPEFLRLKYETDRLTIRELKLPGLVEILLAVTHFQSKRYWSDDDQALECNLLSASIQKAEKEAQHTRTVLIGDFNMNPFETGMVAASGLHAVMTREIALRGSRRVSKQDYPFFYNPMWSHFGDASENPPGTHYYTGSRHKEYFWHMFDQVLLRPGLIELFEPSTLKILSTDGINSFVTKHGLPDNTVASDHLPILFELNL